MAKCNDCNSELAFVDQYKQWFCHTCQKYPRPQPPAPGPEGDAPPAPVQQDASPGGTSESLDTKEIHAPAFSALIVKLQQGQAITAEPGAMMYMHRSIEIDTHGRKGGFLKGLATAAFGGESFFVNTFRATTGWGELALVSPLMGDIKPLDLSKTGPMILQSGAYLASTPSVNLDTKWQGLKGFMSEKDFIMLHASGAGTVWVSSFGGIVEKELQAGETLAVDTGHLVAFRDNMQFEIRRVGGWKSTILSGEGLVTDLTGPGKILMQTRHLPGFASELTKYLPQQNG